MRLVLLAVLTILLPSAAAQLPVGARAERLPMSFSVFAPCGGNASHCAPRILARGVITAETPASFTVFWSENRASLPPVVTVVFSSKGGDLGAAMELGKRIRAAGLRTAVARSYSKVNGSVLDDEVVFVRNAACVSACVFAFSGGVARSSEDDGVLGVHQFYGAARDLGQSAAQATTVVLADYLRSMGVDRSLLDMASLIEPTTMRTLTRQEARYVNLDNASPSQTTWKLDAAAGGALAAVSDHFDPDHGMSTKLALYRKAGVVQIAIGVGFAPAAFGKPKDSIGVLNTLDLFITLSGGRTTTIHAPSWTLKGDYVVTWVRLDEKLVDAIAGADSMRIASDTGGGIRHLTPDATFELKSLHALLPAVRKH